MPEATNSVQIARPPAEVFAFLADGTNDRRWRGGVIDIRLKSGSGVGAVYEQGVKGPFGRRVPADYEITEFDPDRRIGFRAIAGPVRPEGTYELQADGRRHDGDVLAPVLAKRRGQADDADGGEDDALGGRAAPAAARGA